MTGWLENIMLQLEERNGIGAIIHLHLRYGDGKCFDHLQICQ